MHDSVQQVGEERPFRVTWLVLCLNLVRGDLRTVSRKQHPSILDGPRLTDSRGSIDQRAGNPITKTARDQIVEGLDRLCADPIVISPRRR